MNPTLEYVLKKFNVDPNQPSPITLKFSRYGMIDLFRELNFITGVEIGTEHGNYAAEICGGNPQLKLFCIDSWSTSSYYHENTTQKEMDYIYKEAKDRLSKFNCQILKTTSMEAVKKFKPNSLDFVFIDGNHNFEFVESDIIHWSKIVRSGGIVYGHDYWDHNDVTKVVNAFVTTFKINPWFVLHRGGYMIPCWMYIRDVEN